uniref:SWIM-type domain-containing protein n=1 Tax=Panagrolaimus davidi TaxID=227884 RepID=A0A914PRG4_9BILA
MSQKYFHVNASLSNDDNKQFCNINLNKNRKCTDISGEMVQSISIPSKLHKRYNGKEAAANLFEFARQEESNKPTSPELQDFKASQRLFDPDDSHAAKNVKRDIFIPTEQSPKPELVPEDLDLSKIIYGLEHVHLAEKVENANSLQSDDLLMERNESSLESPDSSSERFSTFRSSEGEIARQSSPDYILDSEIYLQEAVQDASLISDSGVLPTQEVVEDSSEIIAIEPNTDVPQQINSDLSSNTMLKIALNLNNEYAHCESAFPPLKVPGKQGFYLAIIPGDSLKNIADIFGSDMVSPWNSTKSRAKQYFVNYTIENGEVTKYERVKSNDKDNFATYCFEFQARHPKYLDLSKKVIGVIQPQNKKPIEGSKVVIFYKLLEDSDEITAYCSRPNFEPRLNPSNSAAIKSLLRNNTPRPAIVKFNESNSIVSGLNVAVTEKQAQNAASYDKDREALTNKGVKQKINFETILKLVQDQEFVMEYSQVGNDMFIFLATKASLHMMKASTVTVADVNKIAKLVEDALKLPSNQRYSQLKKIVSSPEYSKIQGTGLVIIDTTFNLSCLHLTAAMCTSPHLLRDNKPASFTGCYMLSTKKDLTAYEYMAKWIDKLVDAKGRIFRGLLTDADPSLNVFLKATVFATPSIKLQCMIHLKENIEDLCDHDSDLIINDIFGTLVGDVRYKGLLDELTFPEFETKLEYLLQKRHWLANPRLVEWFSKGFRRQKIFQRYGVVSRIKAGLGFNVSETNTVEGENMVTKDGIDDNTPVQILIKKLQKRMHEQLTSAGMAFVQHKPVSLRNPALFVGAEAWRRLSIAKKKEIFLKIGLCDTDIIKGFEIAPTTFPSALSPNLTEKEREAMVLAAKNMEVLDSSSKGTFVVMTAAKPITVIITTLKIQCSCNYKVKHLLICEHLLAVNFKHPELQILHKLESEIENESMTEKHERATAKNSGAKPGTSRRRGALSSRNKKAVITEIRDCESRSNNNSVDVLHRIGAPSSQPMIAPVSSYNSQKQLETRPNAVQPRPATFHPPTANALRNFKSAYGITENELWFNANAFYLKYSSKVRDAHNRQCCQCRMDISKSQKIVFTHLEHYEYVMKTNNQIRVSYGERICCAKYDCFISRYPYADPTCINASEINEDEASDILSAIFAP